MSTLDCILLGVCSWCCGAVYIIRRGLKEEKREREIQEARNLEKTNKEFQDFLKNENATTTRVVAVQGF
tara:strand:- start:17 stop:223 length:207 start_codon:yes stop_codon:yes gene_type:complete